MVRVEVSGQCTTVVMDMIAADWKLSHAAMNEVAELFALIDLKRKNWWNVNECYNYIRRVPVDLAEAVAAKLVAIADACRPQTVSVDVARSPHFPLEVRPNPIDE